MGFHANVVATKDIFLFSLSSTDKFINSFRRVLTRVLIFASELISANKMNYAQIVLGSLGLLKPPIWR
jgi:uncharacterized membrane protein